MLPSLGGMPSQTKLHRISIICVSCALAAISSLAPWTSGRSRASSKRFVCAKGRRDATQAQSATSVINRTGARPGPLKGYGSAGQGCHNAPSDVRLAVRAADVTRQLSMEHEAIVDKLCPRQVLCVHHKLVRFNPLTYRGGNRRTGGRGRPYSEPNRDQSGGNGKQDGLAHLSSPIHSAQPQHAVAYAGL